LTKLEIFLKRITKLNYNDMMQAIWEDPIVQEKIIELNTDGQLWKGRDAENKEFPEYSYVSKDLFDKPDGPIRLYDTGAFYDSFRIIVKGTVAEITANSMKEGVDLVDKYSEFEIYGLTEESKTTLLKTIRVAVEDYLKESLRIN
jgi:hypothetical protein